MRLQLRGIRKWYGAERALNEVDLALAPGAVATIVGGQGSGKSTLAALLDGSVRPGAGQILLDGRRFAPRSPLEARQAGVSVLHDGPSLAFHLTVAENLTLGLEPNLHGWINHSRRHELARNALSSLQSEDIPLDLPAGLLSASQRRRVEIVRALMGRPRLIAIDNPGPLGEVDLRNLFAVLQARAREGAAVLLMTRSLEAARELGGSLILLREGSLVATMRARDFDRARAMALLEGREAREVCQSRSHRLGRLLLELKGVATSRLPGPIDLTLRRGEILGIAGYPGSGRSALLRAIFGLEPLLAGSITLNGSPLVGDRSGLGIGLASDREIADEGLLPSRSVAENLTLARVASYGMLGWFSCERRMAAALDWMEKLKIEARHPRLPAEELTRSNRRKLSVGRLLQSKARLLLLDEPGSGIDAASRQRIHHWIGELAAEGKSIIITSSVFPELLALADTVAVMRKGRLREVRPAKAWTPAAVESTATGILNRRFSPSL